MLKGARRTKDRPVDNPNLRHSWQPSCHQRRQAAYRRFPAFREKRYFYDNYAGIMKKQNSNISCTFQWCCYHGKTRCEYNVNAFGPGGAHMHQQKSVIGSDNGVLPERHQPSSEPILTFCLFGPRNNHSKTMEQQYNSVHTRRTPKTPSASLQPFCTGPKALINAKALKIFSLNYELTYWAMTRITLPVFHECFKVTALFISIGSEFHKCAP